MPSSDHVADFDHHFEVDSVPAIRQQATHLGDADTEFPVIECCAASDEVHRDPMMLAEVARACRTFLHNALHLDVPDRKVSITPVRRGVDLLGYVLFSHYRVLRPVSMRRVRHHIRARTFAYLDDGLPRERLRATFASYDGLLRSATQGQEWERLCVLERCMG